MLMVITHMVAKVMFNKINKILLVIFVFSCAIFPYGNVFAVNYNSGLYNAGLYSDTAPSTPTSSPVAGLYNSTQSVTLSATGSTSIRYSTTSTPADCSSGTLYTTPISVSSSETIYVKACNNYNNFSTASFDYVIDTTAPATLTASPSSGTYSSSQTVTLSSVGSTSIRYSTTSTPADCSSGTLYTTPISVSSSQTIYAKACDDAGNSSTLSFVYIISANHHVSSGYMLSSNTKTTSQILTTNDINITKNTSEISEIKKVTKNLKLGMTNKDVKTLQLFLIQQDKGLNAKALKKNGATNYFGKLTKSTLAEWQKKNNLTPDGIFGLKTRAEIKNL